MSTADLTATRTKPLGLDWSAIRNGNTPIQTKVITNHHDLGSFLAFHDHMKRNTLPAGNSDVHSTTNS